MAAGRASLIGDGAGRDRRGTDAGPHKVMGLSAGPGGNLSRSCQEGYIRAGSATRRVPTVEGNWPSGV